MTAAVGRRLLAEFTGTGLLVAVVVGSGIAATRLTADGALRLLVNSLVTALGLVVLIVVFIPASGAHFNPVVTAADWTLRRRTPRRYGAGQAAAVVACQVAGAIAGAALADAMFSEPVLSPSPTHRGGPPILLSEVIAAAGLLFVIVSLVRTGRTQHVAWAVGAWIGAAYWFTASTAFANPAVTIGRTLTSTYAGIAPVSAPAFIAAQLVGGTIGTILAVIIYPARPGPRRRARPARWLTPEGTPMTDIPVVLFVCTHNAGRSQMAAALLDHAAAGRVRVTSAGSQPAGQLNPAVVQAMAEIGLDLSREYPKPLTAGKVQAADVVITMGCGDACPVYPGKRYLDWNLPDPAGLPVEQVRPIRDNISRRVQQLLAELVAPHG